MSSLKLPSSWSLPAAILQRIGQKSIGKQRAMVAEGHLLLILHRPPRFGHRLRQGVYGWRDPQGTWRTSSGAGIKGLWQTLENYQQAEAELTAAYTEATTAQDYFRLLEDIAPLQFSTRNFHKALQMGRELVPDDVGLIDLRDGANDVERSLDLLYLNAKNAQDFAVAVQAERQAELSSRLNILLAIFLPLTATASLFGMNLHSGIEDRSILLFWGLMLSSLYLGLMVCQWVMTGQLPHPSLTWLRGKMGKVLAAARKRWQNQDNETI